MNAFAANVTEPPFDDVRVRKAMQMALDLDTIVNTFFKGQGSCDASGDGWGCQGCTSHSKSGPKRSRRAIGTTRKVPRSSSMRLDIRAARMARDFKTSARIWGAASYAEIAAAYWAEIGVDVELDAYTDFAQMFAPLFARSYEGMMSATAGTGYAPAVLLGWHRSGQHVGTNLASVA